MSGFTIQFLNFSTVKYCMYPDCGFSGKVRIFPAFGFLDRMVRFGGKEAI